MTAIFLGFMAMPAAVAIYDRKDYSRPLVIAMVVLSGFAMLFTK